MFRFIRFLVIANTPRKVYTALERHADAVVSFEKAVELGPSDRTLLYQLGQAYRRNGNLELARKLLAASNEAAKAREGQA